MSGGGIVDSGVQQPTLPSGTLTFLFTDVERSTKTLTSLGDHRYAQLLAEHHRLLRAAIGEHGGHEVGTAGDGFFVVFERAADAVSAALAAQIALAGHSWPEGAPVRVRMGIHTGDVLVADTGYVGISVHEAARIGAAGHGGQVLVSATTARLVGATMPTGASLLSLGLHRLKDLAEAEEIFQLAHPALQAEFPPLAAVAGTRSNLPARLDPIIGRERELAEVGRLLESHRLVSILGAGGAGKTTLAMHLAAGVASAGDPAFFVELAPVTAGGGVVAAACTAVGVRAESADAVVALQDFLGRRRAMLVLDNCEHVLDESEELVRRLLAACPDLRVLATSREPLGVRGEQVWRIPPLDVAAPEGFDGPHSSGPAVELFVARAREGRAGFDLTEADRAVVETICARLDGLPLAIELAAARARSLAPSQLLERLDDRFRLLRSSNRAAPDRQQTLEAAVAWSYEALAPLDQTVLRRCAAFAGGWTLDAAESVCAFNGVDEIDVLDSLASLVDKSLVEMGSGDGARYRLLETVRAFVLGRSEPDEAAEAQRRHLGWLVSAAAEARAAFYGPEQGAWLSRFAEEIDNIRVALERAAVSDELLADGLALAGHLHAFFVRRGFFHDAVRLLPPLIERRSIAPVAVHAAAMLTLSDVLGHMGAEGDNEMARLAEEAATASGQAVLAAEARFDLLYDACKGYDEDAARALAQFVATMHDLGDDRVLGRALQHLARVPIPVEERLRAAEQGLALAEAMGDAWSIGSSHVSLGWIAAEQDRIDDAVRSFETCLGVSRANGFAVGYSRAHSALAIIAAATGDLATADEHLAELRDVVLRLGERRVLGTVLVNCAVAAEDEGDAGRTIGYTSEALDALAPDDPQRPMALVLHAAACLSLDDRTGARAALEEAVLLGLPDSWRERADVVRDGLREVPLADEPA